MTRKILFVVNADWFFLSHRLPIALEALAQGYEVHVAAGLTGREREIEEHGIVMHPLRLDRRSEGVWNALRTILDLMRLFRAEAPDVVHLVTIKPVLLGGVAARLAGVRAVVAAISGLGYVFVATGVRAALRRRVVAIFYRLALGHPNVKAVVQNTDDMNWVIRLTALPKSALELVPGSGVDLVRFVPVSPPAGTPIVLLAARLLRDKGVREFVEAARIVRERRRQVRFVLVGTVDPGNPATLSSNEVRQWETEGVVEIWGQRDDMPTILQCASIVVLPSYREGMPKVLLEAAACGRPVVTTNVPGCRDAIDVDVSGCLVPAGAARPLADAIERLLLDEGMRQRWGAAGRALAERKFDVQFVVSRHIDIYRELLSNARS